MALKDALQTLSDRVTDAMGEMSPRDRKLLTGLLVVGVVALIGGSGWWVNGRLNDMQARLDDRSETLRLIGVMADDEKLNAEKAGQIEAELKRHSGTDLSTYMEQTAEKVGVRDRLDSVKEKQAIVDGNLEEKLYAVALSKLTVTEMSKLVKELESNGYPLKVRSLKLKTRNSGDEKLIDMNLDISAWRVVDDAAATKSEG
jgi:hypothetical protein